MKAELAILVTLLGITKSVTNSPFRYRLCASERGFEEKVIPHQAAISLIYTAVKLLQPLKASLPILVMLLGIVISVKLLQPLKE